MSDQKNQDGVDLEEQQDEVLQRPRRYRVILHNDDFTPIQFVVGLVTLLFRRTPEEAAQITLEVHNAGAAVAGVYSHEIAETKCIQARVLARKNEHPLQVSMEPEE